MEDCLIRPKSDQPKSAIEASANPSSVTMTTKIKRKTVYKESTVNSWRLDWIGLQRSGDGRLQIHCKACREAPCANSKASRGAVNSDPFITGTTNIKKYSAIRHNQSVIHKAAYDVWKNQTIHKEPVAKAVVKMNEKAFERMVKLFDITYHLAKHELPFTYYPSLVLLEKRHGVDLGNAYGNPVQARTFTQFLAEDIRQGWNTSMHSARYISIMTVGSTDRKLKEKELVYIKYLDNGIPHTRFFGIQEVESAKADGILDCINTMFVKKGIPSWKKSLIGFGAGGASVIFGRGEAILSRLTAEMPWLMAIHCVTHRLEFAAKDACKDSYFTTEIDGFLSFYTAFYRKSPKLLREVNDIADLLEEALLRPTRVDGTLWVDRRRRALVALERNFPVVVAHLSGIGSEHRPDIKKEDSSKARGWVKKLTSYKFLLHMALYIDVLEELSHLSLVFQRDNVSLPDVVDSIITSEEVLREMAECDGPRLQSVREECSKGTYRGVELIEVEQGQTGFIQSRKDHIEPIVNCLRERFGSFSTNSIFGAVTKLDPKNWPKDLQGYGDKDVKMLLDHFHDILIAHGCKVEGAMAEWARLKKIVKKHYSGMPWQELWTRLFKDRQEEFSNFLHLLEILQVIPLATAKVERAFSFMKRVRSDWRVKLDTQTIDDLMMISIEGPPEKDFSVESAVTRWYKAGKDSRRPHVQPHGRPASAASSEEPSPSQVAVAPAADCEEEENEEENYEDIEGKMEVERE